MNYPSTKTCSKCKIDKPLEEFSLDKKGKYGRHSSCKECILRSRGKEPKPKTPVAKEGYKFCSKCKQEKLLEGFYPDKRANDGRSSQCRDCNKGYTVKEIGKFDYLKEIPFEPDGFRYCTKCKEIKPLDEFQKFNRNRTSRYRRICTSCKRKEGVEYIRSNREKIISYRNLNKSKARERYLNSRNTPEKLKVFREKRKAYRLLHSDKMNKSIRISKSLRPDYYRLVNKVREERRRARKQYLPNTLTKDEWLFALEYFKNCCAVCGKDPKDYPDLYLAADHWIALSDPREDNPGTVATNTVPLCHTRYYGISGCNNSKKHKDPEIWLKEKYSEEEAQIILDKIQKYFDIVRNK